MAENTVSVPFLTDGKFTGRALTHIQNLTTSKISEVESRLTLSISKKVDQAALDSFLSGVEQTLTDSAAQKALAAAQAAQLAERTAREEADSAITQRLAALESATSSAPSSEISTKVDQLESRLNSLASAPPTTATSTGSFSLTVNEDGIGTLRVVNSE